jgi:uncharacterized protein (TIGR02266 family)
MAAEQRDRRTGLEIVVEGQEQGHRRRMGDRRDSPRIPLKLKVRYPENGEAFVERDGDIALGGVYYTEAMPPQEARVEVRFSLPTLQQEAHCTGEILRISSTEDGRPGVHVRFDELPVELELALARFIDDQELAKKQG